MTIRNHYHEPVLVRAIGDVGSAIAVSLVRAGYPVVVHDEPAPAALRRGMAFVDAVFDGAAELDGVTARRVDFSTALPEAMGGGNVLVTVAPVQEALNAVSWYPSSTRDCASARRLNAGLAWLRSPLV